MTLSNVATSPNRLKHLQIFYTNYRVIINHIPVRNRKLTSPYFKQFLKVVNIKNVLARSNLLALDRPLNDALIKFELQ